MAGQETTGAALGAATYDDVPEVTVRTVLAVPIAIPSAAPPTPASPAGRASPARDRRAGRRPQHAARHRMARPAGPAPGTWRSAALTGLIAAATVFVVVTVLLLLADLLIR